MKIILTIIFLAVSYFAFSQDWQTVENTNGNFTFSIPEQYELHNTNNATMYSYNIDSTIIIQLHYTTGIPEQRKTDDVLTLYTQFMLYILNESHLLSREVSNRKDYISQEIGIRYKGSADKIPDLIFSSVYFWDDKHVTLTVSGKQSSYREILSYKTSFFNSFQFNQDE